MRQTLARKRTAVGLGGREVVFSLAEARRALRYIAPIAKDAAEAYRRVQHCRLALNERLSAKTRDFLDERRAESMRKLNAAIDDCNAAGVDLIDIPHGVVRFNAHIDGRFVALTWQPDESIDDAWSEMSDTFTQQDAADRCRDTSAIVADRVAIESP